MAEIKYSGNEKQIINELISLHNDSLRSLIKEFSNNGQQVIINSYSEDIKYYSRCSYIKMLHLFHSVLKLVDYPDEAKIIIRGMFEHTINLIYIFDDVSKQDEKIKRFFSYQTDIASTKFAYKTYNTLTKLSEIDEYQKSLLTNLDEELSKYNVSVKRDNFMKTFEAKEGELKNWTGKNFTDLFMDLMKVSSIAQYRHFFYRIYDYLNLYVHCVEFGYPNIDGAITDKLSDKDIIESMFLANFLFSFYLQNFYFYLKLDFHNTSAKLYIDKFYEISELYELRF